MEAEEERQKYIKHESALRACSFLYVLFGLVAIVTGGISLRAGFNWLSACYVAAGIIHVACAIGLHDARAWVFRSVLFISLAGLVVYPLGTLMHLHVLCMILAPKGRRIFRPDYQSFIAETPHIKIDAAQSGRLGVLTLIVLVVYGFYKWSTLPG